MRQTSRLLALTGPTIIAVDQLDGLFAQSTGSILRSGHSDEQGIRETLGPVAEGLLQLRESTARTLTVAACLPDTWTLIKTGAAGPVADRFREISILERIPSEEIAYAIVAKRFAVLYGEAGFQPPHPTWPVAPTAFTGIAGDYTPRLLMQFIEKHIGRCLGTDQIDVLEDFEAFVSGGGRDREPSAGPPVLATGLATGPTDAQRPLAALDTRYAELRECADVVAAIDPTSEDVVLPELLAAGLHAWVIESRVGGDAYVVNPATTRSPPVHATLRHIVDARSELDVRWAFRGLAATNALAVTNRVKSARTRAEPVAGRYPRRLIILRNEPWPNGPRSTESLAEFLQAGGEVRPISESDLRTFSALRTLLADDDVGLASWLTSRRPARGTTLLRETLKGEVPFADAATVSDRRADVGVDADRDEDHDAPQAALAAAPLAQGPRSPTISVGTEVGSGGEYPLDLVALREHTLVIGASGSGKSVVVRTMVEACALQGISSIVLDSNNDLARLGDRWPEIPATWGSDEIAAAARYHDATDVVVWTPGISEGRPLSLPSLPDLTAAPHGSDEQQEILNEAISILAPRAKLTGSTGRASKGEAVLRQALLHHAERQPTAATSLTAFIKQLANLPAAVLTIPGGQQIAADLAGLLEAARTNDPLFAGDGTPLDVGVLLRPKSGKRARVSVISLVGLGSDDQRQAFVNQLQLALMTWLRAHPERANALGGLYVMDEAQAFAPTAGRTACTNSTNTLAAQARKFGLGLVFATQAPRSLQTKIVNSCGTQFVGRLSGSASLAAARDLAQSRGSVMLDVGMLGTGAFYATRPGDAFTKVATRLCLSHHPQGPLTRSEVVTRAAASLASEVGSEA